MTKAPFPTGPVSAPPGRATVPLVMESCEPGAAAARRMDGTLAGRLGRGTGVMEMLGVEESLSAAAATVCGERGGVMGENAKFEVI